MTHYVKMDTVDMHTSCPVASRIKELEDHIKGLNETLVTTDTQRRDAEKKVTEVCREWDRLSPRILKLQDTITIKDIALGNYRRDLDLISEQRDSAEKALENMKIQIDGLLNGNLTDMYKKFRGMLNDQ